MKRPMVRVVAAAAGAAACLFAVPGAADAALPIGRPAAGSEIPRTGTVVVLRPNRVDVVQDGIITASSWRPAGPVALPALAALVAQPYWLGATSPGVWRLTVGLVQTPGTDLTVAGPAVRRLELQASSAGAPAAFVTGVRARVTLADTTVVGVSADGVPASPAAPRPWLRYSGASTVSMTRTVLDHLGGTGPTRGALNLSGGTTGSLSDVTLSSDTVGATFHGSGALAVRNLRVRDAVTTGLVLSSAPGLSLRAVDVSGSGGDGVSVSGPGSLPSLAGVVSHDNRGDGLRLVGQAHASVTGVATSGNRGSGVDLDGCAVCLVRNVTSRQDGTGLLVGSGSHDVTVAGVRTTGDRRGVAVSRLTQRTHLRGLVSRDTTTALAVAGRTVDASVLDVSGGTTGVSVAAQADGVRLHLVQVRSLTSGAVLGGRGVALDGLRASAVSGSAVTASGTATSLHGLDIRHAATAVEVGQHAHGVRLTSSTAGTGGFGLRVAGGATGVSASGLALSDYSSAAVSVAAAGVALDHVTVLASRVGLRVSGAASSATLADSRIVDTDTGVTASGGVGHLVLRRLLVRGDGSLGVFSTARRLDLDASTFTGTRMGLDLHGNAVVSGTTVSARSEAVHVAGPVSVSLTGLTLAAGDTGLHTGRGSKVYLTDSAVRAPHGVRGKLAHSSHNHLPAGPLPWLGLVAVLAISFALVLEVARRLREHPRVRLTAAPAHVLDSR